MTWPHDGVQTFGRAEARPSIFAAWQCFCTQIYVNLVQFDFDPDPAFYLLYPQNHHSSLIIHHFFLARCLRMRNRNDSNR